LLHEKQIKPTSLGVSYITKKFGGLDAGNYRLNIRTGNKSVSKKIVKY
jgi:hypothetical protein